MNIFDMPWEQFYVLKKDKTLPLLEAAEKFGYKTDLMGIEGMSTKDLEPIEKQFADRLEELRCSVIEAYTQVVEAKYGDLSVKVDVDNLVKVNLKPVTLKGTGFFYFQSNEINFEALKVAHKKDVLRDFILMKYKPKTEQKDVESSMRIEYLPTLSGYVVPKCLRESQDYHVWAHGTLSPSLTELFEEIPQIVQKT